MELLLVASADLTDVVEKGNVGTLQDHNPEGVFDAVHVLNPPTPNPGPRNPFESFTVHYTKIPTRQGLAGTLLLLLGWAVVAAKAVWFVRRSDIDIIRGQGPYLPGLVAVLAQHLTPTPAVVSLHNDYDARQQAEARYELLDNRCLSEAVERYTISTAAHVFVLTSYLQTYAVRHGADPKSIHVFPHQVDPGAFESERDVAEIRKEYGISQDGVTLVFVGRLVEQKDPITLLRGFERAKRTVPNLELLIVGDGYLMDDLRRYVDNRDLADVTFTGFIDRSDVAGIMAASDAFVLPTLFEGFGYVFVEALSKGLPIVSTDIPHTKDIFDDESAVLFEPGDPDGLADALVEVADDDRRAKLRAASRENFQRFTATTVQRREAETFRAITSGDADGPDDRT